jgi:DNA polymerase I
VTDFEYHQPGGGLPDPLCVVARELRSGTIVARWLDPAAPEPCPYDTGPESVFVAHNASAECLCHLMLGWPLPAYVMDTYASFRCLKNGTDVDRGASLLVAASRYNIATIAAAAKDAGREIAMQGRAHAEQQRERLIRYCRSDVDTNSDLLQAMLPEILAREQGLPQALIFGEYMKAVASVDYEGVPTDVDVLTRLKPRWPDIRMSLITAKDTRVTDCYIDGHFNKKRFEALLDRLGQLEYWPRTEKGYLSLEDGVFRRRAHGHPVLKDLYELYYTLDKMKSLTLHVGPDGRHRAIGLFPFGAKTGRNTPKGFIFAPAVWVRHLIKPEPGWCVAYSDYEAEEVHIAARVSGDPNMIQAIESGDPYTWYAKSTGLAPPDVTKQTHKDIRDKVWKPGLLSQFYGTTAIGLSARTGMSYDQTQQSLIQPHQSLFKVYWNWANNCIYSAVDRGFIRTRFGWTMVTSANTKLRTLLNWPIQAAGADILRLAIIGLTRNGIRVCAPVHDAVLWTCREDELEDHKVIVHRIMRKAAAAAIGSEIPVDTKVFHYPERYVDGRGTDMFNTIVQLLGEVENQHVSSVRGDIYQVGREVHNIYNNIHIEYPYVPDTLDIPDIPDIPSSA